MSSENIPAIEPGEYQSKKDKILSRIAGLQKTQPRLYEALRLLTDDLDHVVLQLNPIQAVTDRAQAALEVPPTPSLLAYTFTGTALVLNWLPADPAGSTFFYELREGEIDWETADFILRTPSLSAALDPINGSVTYRLKSLNSQRTESPAELTLVVPAPSISTPSVSAQVIDNNVLLSWTEPTSDFNIAKYEIYKNGNKIGETLGTFIAIFETVSGTYTYGVKAVDIGGNTSLEGTVDATVDQPPDFELLTSVDFDLSAATLVNMYYENADSRIYGPVDITETFQDHFDDHLWADPEDQVNAGYDIFIQENEGPGTITTEEEDLGSTLNNVIVNVAYSNETLPNTYDPTIQVEIRGSTTPGGGSFVSGASQFFTSVRYVTVRITVTGGGADTADSMCKIWGLQAKVDVKYAVDGNVIAVNGTDVGGTEVEIPGDAASGHGTKTFSDIDSITLAPLDDNDQAITAIYEFTDVANPTEFYIYCFDNAGRRVDATVSWKVRGILA